jgi:hypothetical protein
MLLYAESDSAIPSPFARDVGLVFAVEGVDDARSGLKAKGSVPPASIPAWFGWPHSTIPTGTRSCFPRP